MTLATGRTSLAARVFGLESRDWMNKVFVLVDTNIVRNEQSVTNLFGSRNALIELRNAIELVVPEMVIEEIISQKRSSFDDAKQKLLGNPLLSQLSISTKDVESLCFDYFESALRQDCSIPFTIAQMPEDVSTMATVKKMALNNTPPFNKGNDKGFKDACIVLAMANFISQHNSESIYVVSGDNRVRDYFENDKRCVCLKSLEDLKSRIFWIGDRESKEATDKQVVNKVPEQIKNSSLEAQALLDELRGSRSFSRTHAVIEKLTANKGLLSIRDKVELFDIAATNDQVGWIVKDPDVLSFYLPLFRECEPLLDEKAYSAFVRSAEITDIRAERREDPEFSAQEIESYRNFADQLSNCLNGISPIATINSDFDALLPKLKELRKAAILESTIQANLVADCFIDGNYECDSRKRFDVSALNSFVETLAGATPEKRSVLCQGIRNRLKEIPGTYELTSI